MKILLGLAGPARAGKDTVADHLVKAHGFARLAFAGPLRDMLVHGLGIPRARLDGPDKETPIDWIGKSPRQLMQTLGTEWGRQLVADDLWINIARQRARNLMRAGVTRIVFTDCRFPNEQAFLYGIGGSVWHLRRAAAAAVNPHASESGLPFARGIDELLVNDGTLDDLRDLVDGHLRTYEPGGPHA